MRHKLLTGIGVLVIAGLVAGCAGPGHATRWGKHATWQGTSTSRTSIKHLFYRKAHFIMSNQAALGLSDEQIKAIEDLKLQTQTTSIQQKADAETVALGLMAALKASEVDSRRVDRLIEKQYAVKQEKAKTYANAYITLKGTLTVAQKAQMKELWWSQGKSQCSIKSCSLCRRR